MIEQKDVKVLRNYSHIFQNEIILRHINGVQLPIAIRLRSFAFGFVTLLIMLFLSFVPPFNLIWDIPIIDIFDNFIIKFFVIPVAVAYVLSDKRFNGKKPVHFLMDQLEYSISPKRYSGFQPVQRKKALVNHTIMFRQTKGKEESEA